jgi:hypothetical protein
MLSLKRLTIRHVPNMKIFSTKSYNINDEIENIWLYKMSLNYAHGYIIYSINQNKNKKNNHSWKNDTLEQEWLDNMANNYATGYNQKIEK